MSKYGICHEGKVLDYKWKKIDIGSYHFYIGDIRMGMITNMKRGGWAAVPAESRHEISLIHGFRTRMDASLYLITYMGYNSVHNREVQERKEMMKRLDEKIAELGD